MMKSGVGQDRKTEDIICAVTSQYIVPSKATILLRSDTV